MNGSGLVALTLRGTLGAEGGVVGRRRRRKKNEGEGEREGVGEENEACILGLLLCVLLY